MTTQSEGIPIPENGGEDAPPPNKRYKIKLAISEYSNDKWLPKKLSKEGLVSGSFSSTLPDRALYRFFAADVGGAGFSILVTINEPEGHDSYFGSFSITGCKGYPEPRSSTGYRNFGLSPIFKDTVLRSNRSTEQGADDENDFAVLYMLNAFNEQTIFRNTPDGNAPNNTSSPLPASRGATFKITYPWQMTGVDQFLSIPVSFSLSLTKIELPYPVPLGTFLPFLFEDNSRVFSITPGYFPRDRAKSEPARTASDLIPLFERFWNHALFINKQINGVIPFPYLLLLLFVLDSELRKQLTPSSDQSFGYRVEIANHPLVCFFRQTLNQGGLTALLNRATQQEVTEFSFDRPDSYAPGPSVAGDYPIENVDFRKRGSYSIYNWELFFHLPFLVAVKLSRDQKFEEAMRWFHFIFDPTGSQPGTAPQKYWVTAPFFERQAPEYTAQRIENLLYQVAQDPSGETIQGLAQAIEEWHDAPFRPHVVARSRTVAFQKAVFARYIENLIAWGDFYFRQDTMESLVQADQLYLLAEKLCGPRPRLVPPVAPPPSRSFNELVDDLDLFSNALLELEDLVPEPSDLPHAGDELPSAPASLTSLYFCIPPNEKLFEYWDIIDDRRFKITHCKTISGADRSMALFAPRIDPAQLVRATAQGISPGAVLASLGAPLPPYRYVLMVQKAIDLTQELRTLGKELEAALERRDGEAMARLRSTLEIELLDKVTELKDAQIREATGQVTAVELSKATVEERRSYYSSREKVSELEAVSLLLQGLSGISQGVSGALSAAAGVVNLLPNFNIGMAGFGGSPNVTVTWGSSNVAGGLSSFAQAAGSLAGTLGTAGGMVGTIAGYQRRKEEWEFQETLAARELTQLDQQMAVARIREEITKKDRVNHGKQIENARSADQFMRSKFTNQELFDWMSGEISAIYFGAYELAFAMAKRAERCFQHELGSTQSFIQRSTFDHQRKGIGCANQLMSQIRQMESAYYEQNRREYELEKDISLAILDPIALLHLKEGRKCTIVIPEAIFDLDHCGHYFRRIKSVSISIPCVAGPFTTIPCKLTLLSNRYRHSPIAANASSYAEDPGQDERFVYNTGGIQMIATSRGHADAGTFELNLRDERYLPFEGCGAISTWQIEFGSPVATFDEQSITDAIIHLKYTARDGGSGLKAVAEDALKDLINEVRNQMGGNGLVRVLNLRREAPDAWVRLTQEGAASFDVEQEFFPYFASNNGLELAEAWLLFRSRGANSTFPFTLEGTSDTAILGTHVDGLFSAALPSPLPMGIGSSFSLSSTQAEELTDLYLVARYQLT